jgi:hypothetical protein
MPKDLLHKITLPEQVRHNSSHVVALQTACNTVVHAKAALLLSKNIYIKIY